MRYFSVRTGKRLIVDVLTAACNSYCSQCCLQGKGRGGDRVLRCAVLSTLLEAILFPPFTEPKKMFLEDSDFPLFSYRETASYEGE
jgi:hypothetical protein